MTAAPQQPSAPPATRRALSVDTVAIVLAALIAIGVVAGALPAVPW